MHKDTKKYNNALNAEDKKICNMLAELISETLPTAENKIWHRNPVWFFDGNPVVGYDKQKACVRFLFWSGQSFDEEGLQKSGSFKAAEIKYTDVSQIKKTHVRRWLKKARDIQWDYKNIMKRKGLLRKVSMVQ